MPRARRVRITRTAISPPFATSTGENISAPPRTPDERRSRSLGMSDSAVRSSTADPTRSHPEDAEGRVAQRGVRGDRQRQAQDRAGVGGVDHAVVPDPGGGVVRVALGLVLRPDPLLELLL